MRGDSQENRLNTLESTAVRRPPAYDTTYLPGETDQRRTIASTLSFSLLPLYNHHRLTFALRRCAYLSHSVVLESPFPFLGAQHIPTPLLGTHNPTSLIPSQAYLRFAGQPLVHYPKRKFTQAPHLAITTHWCKSAYKTDTSKPKSKRLS